MDKYFHSLHDCMLHDFSLNIIKFVLCRMQRMGLNVYLYAPKDDMKHRAKWSDLYSPAEVSELSDLILSAQTFGVQFVFCVSPGLSITFCSDDDRNRLLVSAVVDLFLKWIHINLVTLKFSI